MSIIFIHKMVCRCITGEGLREALMANVDGIGIAQNPNK
jgi:hypothetical protein